MNEQDLKEFKAIFSHTDFRFTLKDGAIVVEKPRNLIYTDPENGDEFFEGELSYWLDEEDFQIKASINSKDLNFKGGLLTSKSYNTRKKCELALMNFISKKYFI